MWNVLGIEPTNDIKKIKTAYAALAKKYNPEEHPEEFRRLHDAYKKACDIAKGRRISVRDAGLYDVTRRAVQTFDTYHSDDENDASAASDAVYADEDGENVPAQETAEVYDFGNVDLGREQVCDDERLDALKIFYLERIHKIVSCHTGAGATRLMWEKMFKEQGFWDIVYDPIFRSRAAKIFGKQNFDRATASRIAEVFGCGSFCRAEDIILNSWKVVITPPVRGRMRNLAARLGFLSSRPTAVSPAMFFTAMVIAVILMIVFPVAYFTRTEDPGSSYEESTSVSPEEVIAGVWKFNSGSGRIVIKDDLTYYAQPYENENFSGKISDDDYAFSDSMDIMNITLRTDNEKYSGTRISVIDLSGDNTVMVVTFPDGSTKYAAQEQQVP